MDFYYLAKNGYEASRDWLSQLWYMSPVAGKRVCRAGGQALEQWHGCQDEVCHGKGGWTLRRWAPVLRSLERRKVKDAATLWEEKHVEKVTLTRKIQSSPRAESKKKSVDTSCLHHLQTQYLLWSLLGMKDRGWINKLKQQTRTEWRSRYQHTQKWGGDVWLLENCRLTSAFIIYLLHAWQSLYIWHYCLYSSEWAHPLHTRRTHSLMGEEWTNITHKCPQVILFPSIQWFPNEDHKQNLKRRGEEPGE